MKNNYINKGIDTMLEYSKGKGDFISKLLEKAKD